MAASGRSDGEVTTTTSRRATSPPPSPPQGGYGRSGDLPSGEPTLAGEASAQRDGELEDDDGVERKSKAGKPSSSYPPIFRAKIGESYADWKRAVSFWLGGEGNSIPKEYVGPRIMVQLRDRAAQLVKHLTVQDVSGSDGMEKIFKVLEKSPLVKQMDKHRIDQHRRKLMTLSRYPGESLESYITRGNLYRVQLMGLDVSLAMGDKFYVGHLLDHAKLTRRDKAMVRTRAGEENEDSVTAAMLELGNELEGEPGFPIGASEPNVAGGNGEEHLLQRYGNAINNGRFRKDTKQALMADVSSETEVEDLESRLGEVCAESVDEDVPADLAEAEREAFALHYKAKHRMAEVKKLRNYYKRDARDPEERRKQIAEKMKDTNCHNCGERGHWARECPRPKPQVQQAFIAGASRPKSSFQKSPHMKPIPETPVVEEADEWDLLVSLCTGHKVSPSEHSEVYMALPCSAGRVESVEGNAQHDVLWSLAELRSAVILDLGCMKSVAGVQWANQLIERWSQHGRWLRVLKEKETFRFGDGNTLQSRFALQFVGTFGGVPVIYAFSIVEGNCPPLLSRPACSQLGIRFDCSQHTVSSTKLGLRQHGLKQTHSGHYIMEIEDFDSWQACHDVPVDFQLGAGVEVQVWSKRETVPRRDVGSAEIEHPRDSHVGVQRREPEGPSSMPSLRRLRSPQQVLSSPSGRDGVGRIFSPRVRSTSPTRTGRTHESVILGKPLSQAAHACGRDSRTTGHECSKSQGGSEDEGSWEVCTSGDSILQSGRHAELIQFRADGAGEASHCEEESQASGFDCPQEGSSSIDRSAGRLSKSFSHVECRSGSQPDLVGSVPDAHLHVEEAPLATEDQECNVDSQPSQAVETKQEMAFQVAGLRDRLPLRPFWCDEAEVEIGRGSGIDVSQQEACENGEMEEMESDEDGEEKEERPQRGLTQQLKKGVKDALWNMNLVNQAAEMDGLYSVMEIFAGKATFTKVAFKSGKWKTYEPVDILLGGTNHDLSKKEVQEAILAAVQKFKPDLVVITPPCGPWSQWQNLRVNMEELQECRRKHLPFWKFARRVWDEQHAGGRLVLTEQPCLSEALELSYMRARPSLFRVVVDQCVFGLQDPESHKFYRKTTALDVNDQEFATYLAETPRCSHHPEEHQRIEGTATVHGRQVKRSQLAAHWTRKFCERIQRAALKRLQCGDVAEPRNWKLHQPTSQPGWIAVMAVEGVQPQTPEEILRSQLKMMGSAGERFDFITFEGDARALPKRVRNLLAHLHVTLGHLSNERLARMLSLSGALRELVAGANHLRCQVCCMVKPPASTPQVSYLKPSNFNQRVAGDCFHIWDVKNVRYTITHFIDELTDYQVADLSFDPSSGWAAKVLRDRWYAVFGPPDVLLTDDGSEFKGAIIRLNELCGVQHDVVPDQAKWRLGHAERHGAILKVLMLKMVTALQLANVEEMSWCLVYALAAKNRLVNKAGMSPMQAVTGRNSSMPASLLEQITSGKVRFQVNQQMTVDEAFRRAERIRSAAIEACHWLDANETLRKALASRSKAPSLELLKEGTAVYVYDPPGSRKGLARRLQDNVSWSGPGIVVCLEKVEGIPKKAWIRIRTKLKAYPLERIRLATADEMLSAEFITNALRDVQDELEGGRLKLLKDIPQKKKGRPLKAPKVVPPQPEPENLLEDQKLEQNDEEKKQRQKEAEQVREQLHDAPQQMLKKKEAEIGEPSELPFKKKQRLFESLAKQLGAPTPLAEAELRGTWEEAFSKLKHVKKAIQKDVKNRARRAASSQSTRAVFWTDYGEAPGLVRELGEGPWEVFEESSDILETYVMGWKNRGLEETGNLPVETFAQNQQKKDEHATKEAQLITGKLRVEVQWKQLDEDWKKAYKAPILKALQVYFDHAAVEGVPRDQMIDPRKILPSRFVLTNKGGDTILEAELKARWVLGRHRDQELGMFPTMAPTSSLLGHNLLNWIAVQKKWVVHYEDVSAAFLQGQKLPKEREVYVRVPHGYPDYVTEFLEEKLGVNARSDLVRMVKGGFGLAESPRLWYLEYRGTLKELGLHELALLPGMFRAFHSDGSLRAVVCIHVDDTRYAGDSSAEEIWTKLHERLNFGKLRKATEGWQKFCGRWERQDPETYEMYYSMDEYVKKIPSVPEKLNVQGAEVLNDYEKKLLGSILGQMNWAARQGRYDLSYGVSHCQQLAGSGNREALQWVRKLLRRAQQPMEMKVPCLNCPLEEVIVLTASDAAYAAQPRGASQGGITCMLASPGVLEGEAPIAIVEAQSMKIARVVRCSMSAELSMAATAFEHGDYVRAVLGELLDEAFQLSQWKKAASQWRHFLVIDAKTGYDVLSSEAMTSDRKIMIDAAVLREAMIEEGSQNFVRWMPGTAMVSDGLTKWLHNGVLDRVLTTGRWSVVDTPEAKASRMSAACKKRQWLKTRQLQRGLL